MMKGKSLVWNRIIDQLCCPLCCESLRLKIFENSVESPTAEQLFRAQKLGIPMELLDAWTDAGLLLCDECQVWFPIWHGLPVLLPYATNIHDTFSGEFQEQMNRLNLNYRFPKREPSEGERFVLNSFSKEWLEYDFDGVIWTANYHDYEETFLKEVGHKACERAQFYLEVGCGIGITTSIAQKTFGGDAIGVDLSLAALKATGHWKKNPFLHFVEASAFYLPFRAATFDVVYSRGALHHTYSTREAFNRVAMHCRPGGQVYLWVYGKASVDQNLFRRFAYSMEQAFRPFLSKYSGSLPATAFLGFLAGCYMVFSAARRMRNSTMEPYTFRRAMHAARDRFTPQFAHRHQPAEVCDWFREAGFDQVKLVDWREMPRSEQENFERNIGVRGRRRASADSGSDRATAGISRSNAP